MYFLKCYPTLHAMVLSMNKLNLTRLCADSPYLAQLNIHIHNLLSSCWILSSEMDSSQVCLLLLLVLACWRGWVVLFGFFFFSAHFVCSNLSSTLINRNKAVRVNLPHIYSCIQSPFAPQFVCSLLNIKPNLDLSLVIVSVHIAITLNNQSCQKGNNFTLLPQRLVACLPIS